MKIKKIRLKNFLIHHDVSIECDGKMNILVGKNGNGKSTILRAIDLTLSGSIYKLEEIGIRQLINKKAVEEFNILPSIDNLPEIICELEFAKTSEVEKNLWLEGKHNSSENKNLLGVTLKILPNKDYIHEMTEIINLGQIPYEYYEASFTTFANYTYNQYNKKFSHVYIDQTNLSNNQYVGNWVLEKMNSIEKLELIKIENEHYENIKKTSTKLEKHGLSIPINSRNKLSKSVSVGSENIDFALLGKGIQTKLKLDTIVSNDKIDIFLIDEPENHLDSMTLHQVVNQLKNIASQTFITSHSSYICNKVGLNYVTKIIGNVVIQLSDLSIDTIKFFQKSPYTHLLDFLNSEKVILVEGSAENILVPEFYKKLRGCHLYDDYIILITMFSLSAKRFFEIARKTNAKVLLITDNDRNYNKNIVEKFNSFNDLKNIKIVSEENNDLYTLEVVLYNLNLQYYENIMWSQSKMLKEKAEHAYIISENLENYIIPEYIKDGFEWIKNS